MQSRNLPLSEQTTNLPFEIANAHCLAMQVAAAGDRLIDRAEAAQAIELRIAAADAARGLGNHLARLTRGVSRGAVLMQVLRDQGVTPVIVAPAPAPAPAPPAAPTVSKLHAAPGLARGRLANANPSGDFLAAPRCGARTRGGCACRQPAMANGRCRFHGGKSTGPKTAEGLARSRAARLVHGGRSRAVITLRSQAAHSFRRLSALLRASRPAGRGVDRPDSTKKVRHRVHRDHRGSGFTPARAARNHPSPVRSVSSVVDLSPAGHGLLRPDSRPPAFDRAGLRSSTSVLAFAAGYGVHRRVSC